MRPAGGLGTCQALRPAEVCPPEVRDRAGTGGPRLGSLQSLPLLEGACLPLGALQAGGRTRLEQVLHSGKGR